jgi:predicted nucleic acid-binding protein
MEVYYVTIQEHGEEEAKLRLELMASLPVFRIESSATLGNIAAQIKANYRLSVADAWIAALAKDHNAILVHKDPEFEQVEIFVSLSPLPYK